jgi:glucokinase
MKDEPHEAKYAALKPGHSMQVSCGSGLARIYQFLQSDQPCNRPCTDLTMEMDPPAITKAALDGSDPVALEAVDLFLAIIGAEAGYMGMRALATGGIYICGGITPRVRSIGFRSTFMLTLVA